MLLRTVAFLALALAPAFSQPIDRAKVDAAVNRTMRDWGVPGAAVAIVRNDEVLLAQGYGVRELGRNEPVTARTIFAIGSMTKAFTTAAMAMLVDEGKMNWDDPVRKYIDFFHLYDPLADEMVTLRDLVCHRTGLSRNDLLWYNSSLSGEEIIRRIAFLKPSRPFRAAWQYNNLMFLTAGYAVAKTSGLSWKEFIERRIFQPLEMTSSDCSVEEARKRLDHASPHNKDAGKARVISWYNLDNIAPAGAINSNVEDLAKWMRVQLNGGMFDGKRLISARNMAEMHTPQMVVREEDWGRSYNPETRQMAYGMGWSIHDYRGIHLVSHGGAIDGFRAAVTLLPDQKTGIVVLSNLGQENMPEALRFTLIDLLLGLPARDWNAILIEHFAKEAQRDAAAARRRAESRVTKTKPSLDAEAYAGEYYDPGYGVATVSAVNGQLTFAWSKNREPLEHFNFDTFQMKSGILAGQTVQFSLSAEGKVKALNFLGVEFARKSEHR